MTKLKVLFFAADPLSADGERRRLLLDHEARQIEHEVVVARHRDNVEFTSRWATRTKDLRRELLRIEPHIVHFSGHGGGEGLVLDADDRTGPHRVDAAALKEFFSAFRGQIRLVVLNACHSEPQAQAIADAVGCAIGTPSQITDQDAISFSAAFYGSIASGASVQAAFDQARATLRMNACPDGEIPKLVVRPGVDASKLVLKPRRHLAVGTAAFVLLCGTVFATATVFPPGSAAETLCARVREVQRDVVASSTTLQERVALFDAPDAHPDDPMAGPRELVEARSLHRTGDHAAEFALLKQAAEDGNAEAMTFLGLAYLRGKGTVRQPRLGIEWLRKASAKGDPGGLNALGEAYQQGNGVRRSYYWARLRYQAAVDKGDAEAMRNLGNLYRDGLGVSASGARALELYEGAAKAGLVDAMVDAGRMYEDGVTVPRDTQEAFCWYEAAADAGSAQGEAAASQVRKNQQAYDTVK
jgi:hypothetical protein